MVITEKISRLIKCSVLKSDFSAPQELGVLDRIYVDPGGQKLNPYREIRPDQFLDPNCIKI